MVTQGRSCVREAAGRSGRRTYLAHRLVSISCLVASLTAAEAPLAALGTRASNAPTGPSSAACAVMPRPTMRVRLVIEPGVPEDLRPQVETIVATIWRGEGLTIAWLPYRADGEADDGTELWLRVTTKDLGDSRGGDPILGVVRFLGGVPHRDVLVSWSTARGWAQREQLRVLGPLFGSLSQDSALEFGGFEALARRAVALAAAHEVGHFVLASTTHDTTGLMRRGLQPRAVAEVEHRDLSLSSRSRLRLQQRLAEGNACAAATAVAPSPQSNGGLR